MDVEAIVIAGLDKKVHDFFLPLQNFKIHENHALLTFTVGVGVTAAGTKKAGSKCNCPLICQLTFPASVAHTPTLTASQAEECLFFFPPKSKAGLLVFFTTHTERDAKGVRQIQSSAWAA